MCDLHATMENGPLMALGPWLKKTVGRGVEELN